MRRLLIMLSILVGLSSAAKPKAHEVAKEMAPADRLTPKAMMAKELVLPAYQSSTIQEDLPAGDVLLDNAGVAWIAGSTSVWRWDGVSGALQKIAMGGEIGVPIGPLRDVASDGVSLFVADDRQVWRIQFSPIRVLRFGVPVGLEGISFGFAGVADDIHWIHSTGIYWVDRYGKKLQMKVATPGLEKGDHVVYDSSLRKLFIARGRDVLARVFDATGKVVSSKTVYAAKQAIRDFRRSGDGFVGISSYHAFHLDSQGAFVKATPVEGRRRLVALSVTDRTHAFYFNDGLAEVYHLDTQKMQAWQLGDKPSAGCDAFGIGTSAAVCLSSGAVHFFSLASGGAPDRGAPPEMPAAPDAKVK